MLPDFMQDLKNVGLSGTDLAPLFTAPRTTSRWGRRLRGSEGGAGIRTGAAKFWGVLDGKRSGGDNPASSQSTYLVAGWSSLVARWAHNPKVAGSNPVPATK